MNQLCEFLCMLCDALRWTGHARAYSFLYEVIPGENSHPSWQGDKIKKTNESLTNKWKVSHPLSQLPFFFFTVGLLPHDHDGCPNGLYYTNTWGQGEKTICNWYWEHQQTYTMWPKVLYWAYCDAHALHINAVEDRVARLQEWSPPIKIKTAKQTVPIYPEMVLWLYNNRLAHR